ncbi:urease accessory UreF family protein [Paraglaciecola aquimarina]|uniref:Urease accessory protein UreF n=1 Tax=Paraglaciecola aquimarina TaxID=1235557 RepID=A0ABU3SVX7_9ALTE|nr:urease accessory UreF family protein [Paraglaciecola aquimarina]MDU0354155.1 urease accessory UreF family protein [Paraglaciecola aquimarina]
MEGILIAIMQKVIPISPVNPLKLNRLLQLCSANLPVGGFSFSQGLEYAVEKAWVNDVVSTESWIHLNLSQALVFTDLAILKRLYAALIDNQHDAFTNWNQQLIASRESFELHMADLAMGKALVRLLTQLEGFDAARYDNVLQLKELSFVSAFAIAAYGFDLDLLSAQSGFCWTYIDNQVAAATKLVPLGQTQAQNLLFSLTESVPEIVHKANQIGDHEVGASLPHLAMASAWHEGQYTRLFRS